MNNHANIVGKFIRELERVHEDAHNELSRRVKRITPVDTGRLRQSWVKDDVSLITDLHYAKGIEYEGRSPQAPNGMVRINTAEWQSIVDGVL